MNQRRAVSRVTAREYKQASKKEKGRILTTFIKQTKLNRVYAGWLLRHWGKKVWVWVDGQPLRLVVGARRKRRVAPRPRTYGPSLIEPLKKVWYLFDCMCGKRLAVVLRTSLEVLIEMVELKVNSAVRQKLGRISPASIDRLLSGEKSELSLKGCSLTKPGTLLKHQIPIRTFSQWESEAGSAKSFTDHLLPSPPLLSRVGVESSVRPPPAHRNAQHHRQTSRRRWSS